MKYLILCSLLLGCATQEKSIGLGGLVGGSAGMVAGAIADAGTDGEYRTRNVVIGGLLGGVTGAAAGALIHSSTEKKKEEAYESGKKAAPPVMDYTSLDEAPNLVPAEWRAEVVDTKRVGNRLIPKHVEYVISSPARWEEE